MRRADAATYLMGAAEGEFLERLVCRNGKWREALATQPLEKLLLPILHKTAGADYHHTIHERSAIVSFENGAGTGGEGG